LSLTGHRVGPKPLDEDRPSVTPSPQRKPRASPWDLPAGRWQDQSREGETQVRNRIVWRSSALIAVVVAMVAAVSGAGAGVSRTTAGGQVCVLLPDTATSIRWVHYDT